MKISWKQKKLQMLLHVWRHNNERRKCGYTDNLVEQKLPIYHNGCYAVLRMNIGSYLSYSRDKRTFLEVTPSIQTTHIH